MSLVTIEQIKNSESFKKSEFIHHNEFVSNALYAINSRFAILENRVNVDFSFHTNDVLKREFITFRIDSLSIAYISHDQNSDSCSLFIENFESIVSSDKIKEETRNIINSLLIDNLCDISTIEKIRESLSEFDYDSQIEEYNKHDAIILETAIKTFESEYTSFDAVIDTTFAKLYQTDSDYINLMLSIVDSHDLMYIEDLEVYILERLTVKNYSVYQLANDAFRSCIINTIECDEREELAKYQ